MAQGKWMKRDGIGNDEREKGKGRERVCMEREQVTGTRLQYRSMKSKLMEIRWIRASNDLSQDICPSPIWIPNTHATHHSLSFHTHHPPICSSSSHCCCSLSLLSLFLALALSFLGPFGGIASNQRVRRVFSGSSKSRKIIWRNSRQKTPIRKTGPCGEKGHHNRTKNFSLFVVYMRKKNQSKPRPSQEGRWVF